MDKVSPNRVTNAVANTKALQAWSVSAQRQFHFRFCAIDLGATEILRLKADQSSYRIDASISKSLDEILIAIVVTGEAELNEAIVTTQSNFEAIACFRSEVRIRNCLVTEQDVSNCSV